MHNIMGKEIAELPNLKSMELKKHVAVIHSNSNISLLQRKISNALLFHAYETLLTKDEHEIQISQLTKLIGYDSHDHKKIKQSLMDLLATVIEWNIVDGDKIDKSNTWNASSIIADASITGSTCSYSYSNKMRKLLYHPSMYGRLNMHVLAKFQSSYGLALYENCNRYQDIGQTPWFDLEKFRKLMGVEDDKYKIFRDFKVRVLDKAVEEVNKFSSLSVEPQLKKINRKVIAIQFLIKRIRDIDIKATNIKLAEKGLSEVLKDYYGFSAKQISDVLGQFDENYIIEKIKLVESSPSYIAGKIKNLGKYLLSALNDDYQPIKSSKKKKEGDDKKAPKSKSLQYKKYVRNTIFLELDKSPESDKEMFLEEFVGHIKLTVFYSQYVRDGLKDVLVEDQFIKYVMNRENWLTKNILQYDKWIETACLALEETEIS